jgi:hypothetical protein
MPSLNFKPQFVPLILSGQKRQTIRPIRIDGKDIKDGDKLYLFTGLRRKYVYRIFNYDTIFKPNYDNPDFVKWEEYKNKKSPITCIPYVVCRDVKDILIEKNESDLLIDIKLIYRIYLNEMFLYFNDSLDLALADGFNDFEDFLYFFINTYKFPFYAKLIKW